MIDSKGNCDNHFSPIEFSYNISYHSSIQMAPFEALLDEEVDLLLIDLKLVNLS